MLRGGRGLDFPISFRFASILPLPSSSSSASNLPSMAATVSSSYDLKDEEEEVEEDEDQILADFLESEILSCSPPATTPTQHVGEEEGREEEEEEQQQQQQQLTLSAKKRPSRLVPDYDVDHDDDQEDSRNKNKKKKKKSRVPRIAGKEDGCCGNLSSVPPELFHHILRFLSSEDLIACSLVSTSMNLAASDESLWRRLYCMRWGLASPAGKLHTCPWKKLYIQRDQEDMVEFVRNTPSEFKEYYIQMQAAKRSQAPLLSQVNDDRIILDRTVADQVSIWRSKRGLTDELVTGHVCSGNTCTYSQIGDVFLCEKTGRVHVCDDTCREVVLDPSSGILVCTISGHCFDRLLSPEEELDVEQQAGITDEAEPFMGSGRFARAYLLGYNCADEKELEATLRFC